MSNHKDTSSDQSPRQGRQPAPPRTTGEQTSSTPPPLMQQIEQNPSPHHASAGRSLSAGGAAGDVPARGGDAQVEVGRDARSTPPKKRYREGDSGAGSSSKSKKKPSDHQPQAGIYQCSVCSRIFDKNKSLFGHMRSHRDRTWRGAYPPPVFSHEEIDEDMAKVIERLRGRGSEARDPREEVVPTPDLNEPAPVEDDGEPSSPKRKDGKDIDLNRSPSSDP